MHVLLNTRFFFSYVISSLKFSPFFFTFFMSTLIAHTPVISSNMITEPLCTICQSVKMKSTLVLDLDETLIHSSFVRPEHYDFSISVDYQGSKMDIFVQKRPGLDQFIKAIAYDFDVFIFTASLAEYAVPVVKAMIPSFHEKRILSRMHCRALNGFLVKDLSIFQRDMSRMIIVDNSAESFMLHPQNGILISTWTGDQNDDTLNKELLPLIKQCNLADDVRNIISLTSIN